MLRDLRHALRMLLHARGWTAVVILSLALGIGANTALFSMVNGMLLTTVPARDPDSLVRFRYVGRNDMATDTSEYGFAAETVAGERVRSTFSYPMYRAFAAANQTLSDLIAYAPVGRVSVMAGGQAEIARALAVSGNYYNALGVTARLGRTLIPDDDRPTASPAAVISSRYWHRRFGTDPAVIGRTVSVNNVPVTIVGVLPPAFTGVQEPLGEPVDIELPLALDPRVEPRPDGPARLDMPTAWWLLVMGRLRPGVTPAQVQGNLAGLFQDQARAGLDGYLRSLPQAERNTSRNGSRKAVPQLVVDSGSYGSYDNPPDALRDVAILSAVVLLVLLLVCANVANLLLSRSAAREKEMSIRLSLGASRGRLIRQLLTESVLLAGFGGALGVLVAYWGVRLLPGAPAGGMTIDLRVLGFVAGASLLTGILFGLAPALRGTGGSLSTTLKATSRSVAGSRSLLGRSLLVLQVAISLVLLVGAGLFLRTLSNLRHVDVGFDPRNLVLFRVSPLLNGYDEARMDGLYRTLLERIAAVPGVAGAAISQPALLSGSVSSTSFFVQGRSYPVEREQRDNSINRLVVSPDFFDVLRIPLVAGRALTPRDNDRQAPKVALINEAAVRKYFPGESPVGQRFGSSLETSGDIEIVGVVHDVKYNSVRDDAPPTMYAPYQQTRFGSGVVEVRTSVTPAAVLDDIRAVVRGVDPTLPMMDVSTQVENIEKRFAQERVFAQAYTLFGALALAVAAVGLFGLMSYSVSRRTTEIGIRMALGAQSGDVLGLVMKESMALVALGVAAGVTIAVAAGRLVATLLFGLAPTDPLTLAAAVTVMTGVAALAGFLPARRASRVDPMVALRTE
jgi:predicted permease